MRSKRLLYAVCLLAVIVVGAFALFRIYSNHKANERVADFQSVMLDFKRMNADQADGDYIFFGDSLVQGMSPYGLKVKFVNMGVGGYTIKQISELLSEFDVNSYKGVILEGGVNDSLGKKSIEEISEDYKNLFDHVGSSINIYAIKTLPITLGVRTDFVEVNKRIEKVNEIITNLCTSKNKCKLISVPKDFNEDGSKTLYRNDGVHLNKDGYLAWKKEINSSL